MQRRADVLWRAQAMGVELPAPSQDMQAWALEGGAGEGGDGAGGDGEAAAEGPAQVSPMRRSSGSKRKVAEPEQVEKVQMQMQSRIPPPSSNMNTMREERRRRGVSTTSPRKATDKRMSIN